MTTLRLRFSTAPGPTFEPECLRQFAELSEDDVAWLEARCQLVADVPPGIVELARRAREKLDDPHPETLRLLEKSVVQLREPATGGRETHLATLEALVSATGR